MGVYGVVNRPQSLKLKSSEYNVPVNNSAREDQPVSSTYGVVNFNRNQSSTMPTQVRSGYAMLNYPEDKGRDKSQPVDSIYGVVQAPTEPPRPAFPQYPPSTEGQSNHIPSSQPTGEQLQRQDGPVPAQGAQQPPILPRKHSINKKNTSPVADSSYEFVELPRVNSLPRSNQSTPISIPSQNRSLPRGTTTYDTVVSPLRRAEPIGAPTSPYRNINIDRSEEDRKEGDGLARGLPETRSDPEGAKKLDLQSPPTRRHVAEYENVVLPPRTGSMSSQKGTIYENMPVSPDTYEYNVPRPQPRSAVGITPGTAEEDRYECTLAVA